MADRNNFIQALRRLISYLGVSFTYNERMYYDKIFTSSLSVLCTLVLTLPSNNGELSQQTTEEHPSSDHIINMKLVYLYALNLNNENGQITITFPSTCYRYIKRLSARQACFPWAVSLLFSVKSITMNEHGSKKSVSS